MYSTMAAFQSTLPARGATADSHSRMRRMIFQSTLPARGATLFQLCILPDQKFQSTLPARGATADGGFGRHGGERFQSTLPARGATRRPCARRRRCTISIHAPRTGSDWADSYIICTKAISIHAPRTGSDNQIRRELHRPHISIHAPRTGSDDTPPPCPANGTAFQSTLPARGATPAHT